jgi:hypothetical protein
MNYPSKIRPTGPALAWRGDAAVDAPSRPAPSDRRRADATTFRLEPPSAAGSEPDTTVEPALDDAGTVDESAVADESKQLEFRLTADRRRVLVAVSSPGERPSVTRRRNGDIE